MQQVDQDNDVSVQTAIGSLGLSNFGSGRGTEVLGRLGSRLFTGHRPEERYDARLHWPQGIAFDHMVTITETIPSPSALTGIDEPSNFVPKLIEGLTDNDEVVREHYLRAIAMFCKKEKFVSVSLSPHC